jgi:hypothetical protein
MASYSNTQIVNNPITKKERRWVLILAIVVMMVTSIPYLTGYARQGDDWAFTGFVFAVEDGNSYIAKMLWGFSDGMNFRTPYTAYPQNGVFAFSPFLLLGKLTSSPGQHDQLVALFQIFRVFGGVMFFFAFYDLLALFLRGVRSRRIGLVLGTLGGGMGWVVTILGDSHLLGSMPLEFYSPETFGFLSIFGLPHLSLGRALLYWGVVYFLRSIPNRDKISSDSKFASMFDSSGIRTGFFWLLLGFMQPITVVIAWVVMFAYLIGLALPILWRSYYEKSIEWGTWLKYLYRAIWAVTLSSPIVLYTLVVFIRDPFLRKWTEQNILPSPHPIHYLLAYGLLLPFVFIGMRRIIKLYPWRGWLPVVWVLVVPALVYAPLGVQRRLAEGVWGVIVLLALIALGSEALNQFRWLKIPISIILLPSTLFLIIGGVMSAWTPYEPLFVPVNQVTIFEYLDSYAADNAVVLASYETGNALPAWTPMRVVIGHGPESADLDILRPRVKAFYEKQTPDEIRLSIIDEFDVRFILWGPKERSLGNWDLNTAEYLVKLKEAGDYSIFRVDVNK